MSAPPQAHNKAGGLKDSPSFFVLLIVSGILIFNISYKLPDQAFCSAIMESHSRLVEKG